VERNGSNLAFIVGHYRSGSTWLLQLLSLHPEIRGVHETHIFALTADAADLTEARRHLFSTVPWSYGGEKRLLRHWLRRRLRPLTRWRWEVDALAPSDRPHYLLDLPRPRRRALERILRASTTPDSFCRSYFDFLSAETGEPPILLEKTPHHVFHVDRIKRLFPDCRLLAVHRDGRDVVVSDQFFSRHSLHRAWNFEQSALAWRRQVEAERAAVDRYGLFSLSYEALHERGPEAVTSVLKFLGLAHGPELVESLLRRSTFRFHTGRNPGRERRGRHARKGVVGDWRQHFGQEEARLFNRIAGRDLVRLGYEQDLAWADDCSQGTFLDC
jgi:Sulfotransferase family